MILEYALQCYNARSRDAGTVSPGSVEFWPTGIISMRSLNRHNCLALALLLLVSHVALTLHVTAHIPVEQSSCEICAGQANPAHAIYSAVGDLLPSPAYRPDAEYYHPAARQTEHTTYRQRGPPTLA